MAKVALMVYDRCHPSLARFSLARVSLTRASLARCMAKVALMVYDMSVSMLQGGFEPILKYKLRAPPDWGRGNVKFHDSVYTTPFSRTQTHSFSIPRQCVFVQLHMNIIICILYNSMFGAWFV